MTSERIKWCPDCKGDGYLCDRHGRGECDSCDDDPTVGLTPCPACDGTGEG